MPLQANLFLEPHIDFRPADNVHPRPIDVQRSPGFRGVRHAPWVRVQGGWATLWTALNLEAVSWADMEFRVPHPCGFCKGAMSATGLFDLTLSLVARYDVCQR